MYYIPLYAALIPVAYWLVKIGFAYYVVKTQKLHVDSKSFSGKIMANDNVKNVAKNGLPFLIVSLICGYATDAIPIFFPDGEFRDWAYRSVPFLSLILLFVIKTLKDFGGMSFTGLLFTICSSREKKRLKIIMDDNHASDATMQAAKNVMTKYYEKNSS